jgi:hypothetical protein
MSVQTRHPDAAPSGGGPGPGPWWVLAAIAALAALLGPLWSMPIEAVGALLVAAALAVLVAGLTSRARRAARRRRYPPPTAGWPHDRPRR